MAKRDFADTAAEDRIAKRTKLLDESSSEESDLESSGDAHKLSINSEFASRFEHNKKREEKQRLEEKYGQQLESESDESSSEDDDAADLINDNVDQEILATIQAIKAKDPRIYDGKAQFFTEADAEESRSLPEQARSEKPLHLKDYHRQNLLRGTTGEEQDEETELPPKSYAQEQRELKDNLVKQIHGAAEDEESDGTDNDDGFLVRRSKLEPVDRPEKKKVDLNVANADRDPETFLSNFIASNAWRSNSPSRFQPFESDDEEDLERAEQFEEEYNRRFENPNKSNISMQSHSRDIIAKYSVRREELSGRQKARQAERARKDAEKMEREEEKSRLKRLKVEEMERKVKQIRQSAGALGKDFQLDEWADVLEADFEDERWEAEMQRRFGEDYYAAQDLDASDDGGAGSSQRKIKKPKWNDDIDIKDIVPDFSDDAADAEGADGLDNDETEEVDGKSPKDSKQNAKKERLRAKEEAKRTARRDRRLIENLVEQNMDLSAGSSKGKGASAFRYRETSPKSFGLTARDILLASDADLNQFAGIKKLHSFRDPDKKRKDKKNISKKARLRQWRRDTFGDENEPTGGFERFLNGNEGSSSNMTPAPRNTVKKLDEEGQEATESKKKRKRSKKSKKAAEAET